jgi:hypothetical protein
VATNARNVFTFAYALVGDRAIAEELTLSSLRADYIASLRAVLAKAHASKRFENVFVRPADAPLRALTIQQRAAVALRRFLPMTVEERCTVLGCDQEQEKELWRTGVNTIMGSTAFTLTAD